MKHLYLAALLLILTLPFCASKREMQPICISSNEVSLKVRVDDLRVAVASRLDALEARSIEPEKKVRHRRVLEATTASEPVYLHAAPLQ